MSKVEVDLQQLAMAVSAAILQFAQSQPTVSQKEIDKTVDEEQPRMIKEMKNKRGRPKKQKPTEVVTPEDIDTGVEEEERSQPQPEFTAPAKRSDFTIRHDSDKKMAKRVQFKKKKRVNQWYDDLTLSTNAMYNDKGEKIKYPPHTPPREAQEEQEYKCGNCGKKFVAFPSYIPPLIEGHQPMIKCHSCNTK